MTVTVTLTEGERTNTIELVETQREDASKDGADGDWVTFTSRDRSYTLCLTMLLHKHCPERSHHG
jgi:hypothetical protein